MRGRRRAAVIACAALTFFATTAAAAPHLVGIEDERILLDDPAGAPAAVSAWAAAGIDVVRIHARWGTIAPAGRTRPAGFHALDPGDPRYRWGTLDRAVDLVHAAGMKIMLTVTGPGPLWTSRAPSRNEPRYKPDPRAFAAFAGAAATRYGDRVDTYLVYNEPNIPGWLAPQMECRRGVCVPLAPHLYRELLQAALPAIKRADPGAEVVAGELAPIGREPLTSRASVPPLTFLRAMACLDERYRPLPRKGPCAHFRPVHADAIGHHPHGVLAAPDQHSDDPNWAKIGDLSRLLGVLDRITATGRFVAPASTNGRFDLELTEFGYQTSPPDHAIGVTLEQQSRYLQQAAYVAWKTPRVRSLVHYQWMDEPVRFRSPGLGAYAGWQSGLFFVNGRPKPAMAAFPSPFVVDGSRFWGQVRPGGGHTVTLLHRGADGVFAAVGQVQTDALGFWTSDVPGGSADDYRFSWEVPAGAAGGSARQRSSTPVEAAP